MPHTRFSDEEIARQGHILYDGSIRQQVDTDQNVGKLVAIDIESGDYRIDADLLRAVESLQAAHPDAAIWSERIGYGAVYAVGAGSIARTAK